MARDNVTKVVAAFKLGKRTPPPRERPGPSFAGRQGFRNALWTDGEKIYSYRMIIAERLADGSILIVTREMGPSRTTRAHIDGIRWAFQAEPLEAVAEERLAEDRREEREARCG